MLLQVFLVFSSSLRQKIFPFNILLLYPAKSPLTTQPGNCTIFDNGIARTNMVQDSAHIYGFGNREVAASRWRRKNVWHLCPK